MKKLTIILAAGFLAASTALNAQVLFLSGSSEPWGESSLGASMNRAFGVGNWTRLTWGTTNLLPTITASDFLYVDGGANQDDDMQAFLTANSTALNSWVTGGGRLFLNSGGWTTGIDTGFGDIELELNRLSSTGNPVAGSPVWAGPNSVGSSYSGNWFAHNIVTGTGLTALTTGERGTTLAYRTWGAGLLVLGGETSPNFWSGTDPIGLKANELIFAAGNVPPPTAVPEPSTYGLIGAAVLVAAGLLRRLRAKTA